MPKFYAFALLFSTLIAKKKQVCFFKPRLTESDYSHKCPNKISSKNWKCYQRCGETRVNSATSSYSNKNLRNVRYELRGENRKKLKKQKSGGMVIVLASLPGFFTYVCVLSHLSHVWLCATLWTVACQAPLSMGFSRQEYWNGLPSPPLLQGTFPIQGSSPCLLCLLHLQVGSILPAPPEKPFSL